MSRRVVRREGLVDGKAWVLACTAALPAWAVRSGAEEGWTALFDGKSLSGWQVKCVKADAGKTFWTVADGAIVCNSLGDGDHDYVWLMTEKEYGDFELRLQVRSYPNSSGNTGVQVRSRYDEAKGWLDGPQVDIHPPAGWRSGLIYDETRSANRWIFPSLKNWAIKPEQGPKEWKWEKDGWNAIYIRCEGMRIVTRVNGLPIADYDGTGVLDDASHRQLNVGLTGFIALQLHKNDRLLVAFKDIAIRPLPAK